MHKFKLNVCLTAVALSLLASMATAAPQTIFERGSYRDYRHTATVTTSPGAIARVEDASGDDSTLDQAVVESVGTTVVSVGLDKMFIGTRIIKDGKRCERIDTKLVSLDTVSALGDVATDPDEPPIILTLEAPTLATTTRNVRCPG